MKYCILWFNFQQVVSKAWQGAGDAAGVTGYGTLCGGEGLCEAGVREEVGHKNAPASRSILLLLYAWHCKNANMTGHRFLMVVPVG